MRKWSYFKVRPGIKDKGFEYIYSLSLFVLLMIGLNARIIEGIINKQGNFDYIILEDIGYFTNWASYYLIFYSLYKLITIRKYLTTNDQSLEIMASALSIALMLTYSISLITGHSLGASSFAAIIKTIIGHYVVPIMVIVYFLFFQNTPRKFGYMNLYYKSWKIVLFVMFYITFILYRYVAHTYGSENSEKLINESFPYPFLSPDTIGWAGSLGFGFAALLAGWSFFVMMDYLSCFLGSYIFKKNVMIR
ncbi:hypothetical protein [[Acholeplasma] multilocale]|uniref:hypothetical protein n=1 Tax=[Acholeplasma] multilocale TaxID=264638 RepID=UPI00047A318F|nr:hypothetical protein [[Acholeplasma] multilocale]